MKSNLKIFLSSVICFALTMTSGYAEEEVKYSGFLTDYPEFKPDPKGSLDLVYLQEGVDFKSYNKVMFDHVLFLVKDDAKYKGIHVDELRQLADSFHMAVVDALEGAYPLVSEPGPGVLRIRVAITDVKASNPFLNTITTILPTGLAISTIKRGLTGTHSFVGESSMEAEFLDSQTNERIGAAIDRKAAAKYKVIKGLRKWKHAEDVFKFWAKRLRKWLDEVHEGK
jgi:hypothetical protein